MRSTCYVCTMYTSVNIIAKYNATPKFKKLLKDIFMEFGLILFQILVSVNAGRSSTIARQ